MFDLQKVSQGHGIQFLQWRHLMANVKIYKCHFLNCFICAKVQTVLTNTQTQRHTNRHRNRQDHRYRRNLADLPKNYYLSSNLFFAFDNSQSFLLLFNKTGIFRRHATHCISPYAIVVCLRVCLCVCHICGPQENGLRDVVFFKLLEMISDITCKSFTQIGLQIPRWWTKWRPWNTIIGHNSAIY